MKKNIEDVFDESLYLEDLSDIADNRNFYGKALSDTEEEGEESIFLTLSEDHSVFSKRGGTWLDTWGEELIVEVRRPYKVGIDKEIYDPMFVYSATSSFNEDVLFEVDFETEELILDYCETKYDTD